MYHLYVTLISKESGYKTKKISLLRFQYPIKQSMQTVTGKKRFETKQVDEVKHSRE